MNSPWQYQASTIAHAARWQRGIVDAFGSIDMAFPRKHDFVGQIHQTRLGPLALTRVVSRFEHGSRTERQAVDDPQPFCLLVSVHAGQLQVVRQGRRQVLGPGLLGLVDLNAGYEWHHDGPTDITTVKLPSALLAARVPGLAADRLAIGQPPLPAQSGTARLVVDLLAALANQMPHLPAAANSCADLVLDLLETLVAEHAARPSTPRLTTLARCTAFIDRHLGESGLDAERVARAMGISVRTLHALFEPSGESFAAYVRAIRLERSLEALRDPENAGVAVKEIGARCGLPNPAHFSQLFRARFGQTPRDLRRAQTR
jgi:AraC family transcriptional regulator, positive regulator of tynA and feaB